MTEMYLEGFPNPFPRGPDGVWAVPRILKAADFPGVPGTDSPQGEPVKGRKPAPGSLPGAKETDDVVVIRDFRPFVPPASASADKEVPGTWWLRHYFLMDETEGVMLAAESRTHNPGELPPELTIPLPMDGWYQVYFNIPVPELRPYTFTYGIDAAFGDDAFVYITPLRFPPRPAND